MFGLNNLTKTQRLVLGIFVLLIVDVIWVASSELTEYIFKNEHFDKPYFSTYLKTSMFVLYLLGFFIFRQWRQQCRGPKQQLPGDILDDQESAIETEQLLSDPIYVPVKYDDKNNGSDGDEGSINGMKPSRHVRFSNLSEVRQLAESQAEDAALARLSYAAFVRAEEARLRALASLPVKYIAKLAVIFCVLWFCANLAYQEALDKTQAGIVNVLSSTSGLFTLVLAAMFPSGSSDRFTLSKLVTVLMCIGGVVLVSLSDLQLENSIPVGAMWALCGACLYAFYLVLIKRKADNEDKLNIPMFFGFVGLFNMVLLWPGFFILHFSGAERFQWPAPMDWLFLLVNGLIGTVISELLWLWACFLTSSLLATLALSLTIPMTMIADTIIKNVSYNWMFYVGSVPIFLSFFAVSVLSHYENWDPVLVGFKKILHCICRRRLLPRIRELDREQTESLIGINTEKGLRGDT